MTLTYRLIKGSPLTAEEVDGNIRTLHERICDLENGAESHIPLSSIQQEGADLIFHNAVGDVMGRISLPLPKMTPRDIWTAQTPYDFWDLCRHEGKIYICHTSHISGESFEGPSHWSLFLDGHI